MVWRQPIMSELPDLGEAPADLCYNADRHCSTIPEAFTYLYPAARKKPQPNTVGSRLNIDKQVLEINLEVKKCH